MTNDTGPTIDSTSDSGRSEPVEPAIGMRVLEVVGELDEAARTRSGVLAVLAAGSATSPSLRIHLRTVRAGTTALQVEIVPVQGAVGPRTQWFDLDLAQPATAAELVANLEHMFASGGALPDAPWSYLRGKGSPAPAAGSATPRGRPGCVVVLPVAAAGVVVALAMFVGGWPDLGVTYDLTRMARREDRLFDGVAGTAVAMLAGLVPALGAGWLVARLMGRRQVSEARARVATATVAVGVYVAYALVVLLTPAWSLVEAPGVIAVIGALAFLSARERARDINARARRRDRA
jgi:hypothetical protein